MDRVTTAVAIDGSKISVKSAGTIAQGHTTQVDPVVSAAQDTAHYTRDLAIVTGLLFAATLVALLVSELQRRAGLRSAARVRQEREERVRSSALAQLVAILQSYERVINLLLLAPHYPVAARTMMMQTLFQRVFSDSLTDAIPESLRNEVLRAAIKAQETLQVATDNQAMHDSMRAALEREAQIMTIFSERLKTAKADCKTLSQALEDEPDPDVAVILEQQLRHANNRAADLEGSPDAYDSIHYMKTHKDREGKLNALYPVITRNTEDAKRDLIQARRLLGDNTVIELQPG